MLNEMIDRRRRELVGGAAAIAAGLAAGHRARAQGAPGGSLFPAPKQVEAGVLSVGYVEAGPADGPAVILLHGWPYDIHSFVEVVPLLTASGYRVIVPYLRGYGTTRFLSGDTVRNGQQAALAVDIVALMDALHIPQAVLAGFDWGARTADIVAALWPERCKALVSVSGYLIGSPAANKAPLPPAAELAWWYQFYFATERGRAGLRGEPQGLCKADLAHRLAAVAVRRCGLRSQRARLRQPPITSTSWCTTTVGGSGSRTGSVGMMISSGAWRRPLPSVLRPSPWRVTQMGLRTRRLQLMPSNSPGGTRIGCSPAASATTCRKRRRATLPRRC